MAASEKLNEKYVLYQILAQNLEVLRQQMELVQQQLFELKATLFSMEDVRKMGENNEIFLPIGSGCFGKGNVTDHEHILVNVGAGIFINERTADAKSFLEERLNEIEKAGKEIEEQAEKIAAQMNELAADIQKIALSEQDKKS
jgi:prefoldin alpha subunit